MTKTGSETYNRASKFIQLLRKHQTDMPMQMADVLLAIARRPGLTMAELAEEVDLAQSSCSRNVAALSEYHRLGKPGLGLVEAVIDPREPRRRAIFLTQKGKVFVTQLMRAIDPDFSFDRDTDARVEVARMHQEAAEKAKAERDAQKQSRKRT
ncbi:helix-turn-helix domain-containing protein [Aminobacter sp. J44]|jgi:DNA-binding MarR family transcriptional regulator|uniref:MarR family transcriptional regulator n=1 Tax=Aminobacter sp. J44 TaxID=935262 RepID=UPI001199630E|nr:helix-turn-helix domain-containing protein [Aminobacter sp. J44]TWG60756.1 DNA-binding MarR family transcriptional regulator [Aminobacter sp. J44]